MATVLAFSSTQSLLYPSASFKGNMSNLKKRTTHFVSINLNRAHENCISRKPLIVLNQAASSLPNIADCLVASPRLRLDNLGPQPGSRKKAKRKGRGHAAGQGGSSGFGMRGQNSRSRLGTLSSIT